MTTKLIVWIGLTAFFAFAGIAVLKAYGLGYAYTFTLLIAPVCYLINKYGISKFSMRGK